MSHINTNNVIICPETRKEFQQLLQKYKNYKIVVKAYAEWCKPCKLIEAYVFELFNNLNIENKILILLNVDLQQDVSSYLKIRALPTIITYVDSMKEDVLEGVDKNYLETMIMKLDKI
jgi:thioredoxin-like negative regulator of GroEL